MKILVGFGGNPNATDTEKWTPLVSEYTNIVFATVNMNKNLKREPVSVW